MTTQYRFERSARRPFGLAMVAVAIVAILILIFALEAHILIVLFFVAVTAPAIWEVVTDARSELVLTDNNIRWKSGARGDEVALSDIDEARLATRLDFSQRARLILKDGRKTTIPGACLPPGRELDTKLENQGVTVKRSLF